MQPLTDPAPDPGNGTAADRPLAVLARVSAMLSSSLHQPELVQAVLSQVGLLLRCDGAFLCEFDEVTDALVFRGSHGLPPAVAQTMQDAPPLPRGRGTFSQLAQSSQPLLVPDLTADGAIRSPFLPWFIEAGYRAMLGVPLMREGRTMGGLVVFRRQAGSFTAEEIDLLSAFAAECALAMAHVRLFALLDERGRALSLSLAEQAAANEVLRVMATSRADSGPVFDTIARQAAALCDGDRCAVFSFDGQFIHIRAHHHWDADGLALFRTMYPRPPGDPSVVAQCVATRRVAHVADTEDATGVPADSLQLAHRLKLRAVVAVPMLRDGEPIGAIGVMRAQPGAFSERQIAVLQTFADQAVIAVETSRLFHEVQKRNEEIALHRDRMESELQLAREIQLGMVPTRFAPPGVARPVQIHALLEPAREIGGDLYDCFWRTDGRLCFVVADVSDKGAPAALYMARTKTLIRALAMLDSGSASALSPAQVLAAVNEDLCIDNPYAMFVTVLLGMLDAHTGTLWMANAGHPAPLRCNVRPDEPTEVTPMEGLRGPPLGVSTRSRYADSQHHLDVGDCLLAYTDGISEAADPQEQLFGEERIAEVLREPLAATPKALVERLGRAVREHAAGAPQADDIALLALMRTPPVSAQRCLHLPRDLDALVQAAAAVDELAETHALPPEAVNRLQLVLDEALSNIVHHGELSAEPSALSPAASMASPIRLWLALQPPHLLAEIEDQGVAFDPTRVPLARPEGPLAERRIGGLGLHFMRRLCASMHYERDGGMNRLLLAIALNDSA